MKIAIHLDDADQPLSLSRPGRLCLYEGTGADWTLVRELPLGLPLDRGIPAVRAAMDQAVQAIQPCQVLVSAEVRGYVYSLLQEQYGFSIWKSAGPVAVMLASVAEAEARRAAEAEQAAACGCATVPAAGCGGCGQARKAPAAPPPEVVPEDGPDGLLHVDLVSVMAADARHNSRSVLGPILAAIPFRPLTIRMDHQPRWFARTLRDLGLRFSEDRRADGLYITVTAEKVAAP